MREITPLRVELAAPPIAPIALRTRVLRGAHDPVLKAQWAHRPVNTAQGFTL